jgi:hypothetical protein
VGSAPVRVGRLVSVSPWRSWRSIFQGRAWDLYGFYVRDCLSQRVIISELRLPRT